MLVLRPIVHQEQQAGGRQALDQTIEQGLCLRINPVQILEDQQERLLLALAQEQPLEGVERALAPLWWIKREERAVLRHGVQHDVQRRVQELAGLFRIEPLDQRGGALEVGKEHRHLLALAFQSGARG